jgi:hypothetical protein
MPEMAARTFQFRLPPRNKSSSQVGFCKRLKNMQKRPDMALDFWGDP